MPINYNSPTQRLNNRLDNLLQSVGIHARREYRACPPRKYVWDFAFPEIRLLIEVQGGTWRRGKTAHTSGEGVRRDVRKNNLAVLHGWHCIYLTSDMICRVGGSEALEIITQAIEKLS